MPILMVLVLGFLPGLIAEERKHPHSKIIGAIGFISLWIHPGLWLLATLWAWKGPIKASF